MKNWHLWPEALPDLLVALFEITLQEVELITLGVTSMVYLLLVLAVCTLATRLLFKFKGWDWK